MKRKLKILVIIFITLLLPFAIEFINLIIIFSLKYKFGITNDSMPFLISFKCNKILEKSYKNAEQRLIHNGLVDYKKKYYKNYYKI